jgi:hypothetical protein
MHCITLYSNQIKRKRVPTYSRTDQAGGFAPYGQLDAAMILGQSSHGAAHRDAKRECSSTIDRLKSLAGS